MIELTLEQRRAVAAQASPIVVAVVVQNDGENSRVVNTVVVMITGNLKDAGEPTTILVDPSTPAGAGSGLNGASFIK